MYKHDVRDCSVILFGAMASITVYCETDVSGKLLKSSTTGMLRA